MNQQQKEMIEMMKGYAPLGRCERTIDLYNELVASVPFESDMSNSQDVVDRWLEDAGVFRRGYGWFIGRPYKVAPSAISV